MGTLNFFGTRAKGPVGSGWGVWGGRGVLGRTAGRVGPGMRGREALSEPAGSGVPAGTPDVFHVGGDPTPGFTRPARYARSCWTASMNARLSAVGAALAPVVGFGPLAIHSSSETAPGRRPGLAGIEVGVGLDVGMRPSVAGAVTGAVTGAGAVAGAVSVRLPFEVIRCPLASKRN